MTLEWWSWLAIFVGFGGFLITAAYIWEKAQPDPRHSRPIPSTPQVGGPPPRRVPPFGARQVWTALLVRREAQPVSQATDTQ